MFKAIIAKKEQKTAAVARSISCISENLMIPS